MKWLLVGQRGVGKTNLLQRLKIYFANQLNHPTCLFLDLDLEISLYSKKSIDTLFAELGEEKFRQLEQETFLKIHMLHQNYILSVGAGFSLEPKAVADFESLRIIWLRRSTDILGRIFFNRPRLNKNLAPLAEFKERYPVRQIAYATLANDIYFMPEGIESTHPAEEKIFTATNLNAAGILTLTPWHFKNRSFYFLRYGCTYFEFRNDLLNLENTPWDAIPKQQRLLSFRNKLAFDNSMKYINEFALTDWALELGPCPDSRITILSCHNNLENETLSGFLQRLESSAFAGQHLKAAPVIKSYEQLKQLLKWQQKDPDNRSILPRSEANDSSRWIWFRLYQKGRQKINFWRDSEGTSVDQPTLFEWLNSPTTPQNFTALLGNPVKYSKTMIEQNAFFMKKDWPVWPILVYETEFKEVVDFLISIGLKAAAVTSPLKKQAYQYSTSKTLEACELESVNTIAIINQNKSLKIHGHNTDLFGLTKLLEHAALILQKPLSFLDAVIWGGGGTLAAIERLVPNAIPLSVRSGSVRDLTETIPSKTQILVWAAGPDAAFPPAFEFEILVDLNYREDSLAREYALKNNKKYLSGDIMFANQAQAQREFWRKISEK